MENENKNTQEEILTSQSPVEETVAAERAVEETTNEVQEEVAAEVAAEPVEEAEEAEMSMEQGMAEMSTMSIKPGQVLNGKVIKVTPDNVFVNINYMSDGIVPKNEFINNPDADLTELIKEGDEIKVSVMKVNDGEGNVLLSKRRAEADASVQNIERAMAEGTSVMAKVKEAVKGGLRVEVMGLPTFLTSPYWQARKWKSKSSSSIAPRREPSYPEKNWIVLKKLLSVKKR